MYAADEAGGVFGGEVDGMDVVDVIGEVDGEVGDEDGNELELLMVVVEEEEEVNINLLLEKIVNHLNDHLNLNGHHWQDDDQDPLIEAVEEDMILDRSEKVLHQ